jgi:hypothetical protein
VRLSFRAHRRASEYTGELLTELTNQIHVGDRGLGNNLVCVCARARVEFVSMCDYRYNHKHWTSVDMSQKLQ